MKTSPILLIAAIIVSGGLGFFIGRSSASNNSPVIAVNEKKEVKVTPPNETPAEDNAIIETASTDENPTEEAREPVTPVAPLPTTGPAAVTVNNNRQPATTPEATSTSSPAANPAIAMGEAVLKRINMGISDTKISTVLETIARNLEAKKLAYDSNLKQDCSGIFHQIKDSLQVHLPALAKQQGAYEYPAFATDRSSRQIADWYFKNDNLLIVEDPLASRNSIRPGSVLFFAKPDKKYKNMTIEMLTDRSNNYTSNGAIMHVAVVTSIQTDADGNVVGYTMMHGRNKSVPASRSGSKEVQSNFTKGLPPFGNWSQQWVAVANIATPKQG